MAWLQHSILRKEVERSLQVACSATAAMQVSWLPVPEQTTSVAVLRQGDGPPFTLIIVQVSVASPPAMCIKAGDEGCRCQGKRRNQWKTLQAKHAIAGRAHTAGAALLQSVSSTLADHIVPGKAWCPSA